MLKALCFLGTGPQGGTYSSTNYVKHDDNTQCYETDLFPEAVNQLYCPDKIIVFVTPQVQHGNYLKKLKKELGCKLKKEELPNLLDRGNSEADLWQIFDTYQKSVEEGDEIILDITHGFRSLPMLAFPVVAYLRQVKQVTLKHILYAPYDARPDKGKNTPIFDLTPFVDLLDWMNAVKIFQHSGDARPIAELRAPEGIDNADKISKSLRDLSEALLINLPLEAQKAAFEFCNLDLSQYEPSQAPFGILIGALKETYKDMGVEDPNVNLSGSLESQYKQIKWYVKNRHYLQAITLIREWLVSWECQRVNPEAPDWLNTNKRNRANKRLNGQTENYVGQLANKLANADLHASFEDVVEHCKEVRKQSDDKFIGIDLHLTIIKLWEDCKIIRNDLAHCGMSGNFSETEATPTFEEISKKVECLCQEIEYLQKIYKKFSDSQNCKDTGSIRSMQRDQIKWYICHKHYLHAISLIREWLIFWERTSDTPQKSRQTAIRILKCRSDKTKNRSTSGRLWGSCQEIRENLSNLEKKFQKSTAEKTMKNLKSFGDQHGLNNLN